MEKGVCRLNGQVECFASVKVKKGDLVEVETAAPSISGLQKPAKKNSLLEKDSREKKDAETQADFFDKKIKKSDIRVLFEDEYFLIIDKPAGLLCSDTEIRKFFSGAFLVHRLDLKTSGLLILAKSRQVKKRFVKLFSLKKIKKTYLAIVDGRLLPKKGKITSFLQRKKFSGKSGTFLPLDKANSSEAEKREGKIIFKSHPKVGKKAVTIYKTLSVKDEYSAVLFYPLTGRTHQIRLHALDLGHPVLGDFQYGRHFKYSHFAPRLFLHSYKLEFLHPFTREYVTIKAPLPASFKKFLKGVKEL